ncbi:MAG: ribosome maturation factor RimM [Oscillospiraceae bacterium]
MKKRYLECGKIVSPHGVIGEIKVQPWCDSPEELSSLRRLYFERGETSLSVTRARVQNAMVIIKLRGVDTLDAAAALRGKILYLDREDLPLAPDEYFIQDLLGMQVLDADDGHAYGTLTDVSETGANDVYHITFSDGTVRLAPAIAQVVISTDLDAGVIRIRPLRGLFDDEN